MNDLIFGRKVCLETIELSKRKMYKIYVTHKTQALIKAELNHLISVCDVKKLDKMTNYQNHQGIVCEVEQFKYTELTTKLINESKLILILDHLQDPSNFGAILRNAECFNVDLVIIPKDRSVRVNGTVTKTSMGASERLKIAQVSNLSVVIKKLKEHDFWIYGTGLETKTNLQTIDFASKAAIIIGNESKGISPIIAKNCDIVLKIDMQGTLNSLNASVASGIVLYEFSKRRK